MEKKTILLYMGGRTDLDNKCRKIIDDLPPGTNVNEFIKRVIVESVYGKAEPCADNDDIKRLELEIQAIKKELHRMQTTEPAPSQPKPDKPGMNEETKNKIESLIDAF